jgi:hypothetical protein
MPHPGALILAESIRAKVRFPPVIRRACDLRVGFRRPYWSASWRSMCGCIGNCILAPAPIRPNSAWVTPVHPKGCTPMLGRSSSQFDPSRAILRAGKATLFHRQHTCGKSSFGLPRGIENHYHSRGFSRSKFQARAAMNKPKILTLAALALASFGVTSGVEAQQQPAQQTAPK